MWREIYKPWDIINWHEILSKDWYMNILAICPTCKSYVRKRIEQMKLSRKCIHCKRKYSYESYVYWVKESKIASRIHSWWSMKEAVWLVRRDTKEIFNIRDIKWLSKQLESEHDEMQLIALRAETKYKHNKIIWQTQH